MAALAALDPSAVLGGRVSAEAEDRLLEATYYDTPDLRLLAEKVTLRRRTGGRGRGLASQAPRRGATVGRRCGCR